MEITKRRSSMNTSLKNARIFDELLDEPVSSCSNIKKEVAKDEPHTQIEVKKELFDEETNFSISSDAFENFHIKKEDLDELTSPMKTDMYENSDSNSRKSFKSARINMYKKRDSPYKSVLERLGPPASDVRTLNFDENRPRQRTRSARKEFETDPMVLNRRQKQIDYGKNTIGYDEYSRRVPKPQRKQDDPHTPDKYQKYSRRGWDGLIKQWRLRLHKYDPDN